MWNARAYPDGDYGWTGSDYVYSNLTYGFQGYYGCNTYGCPNYSTAGYTENELKDILAQIVACETSDGFGCGINDDDLYAAMNYTQTWWDGNVISCTTYLKTNLIYDLETNAEDLTNFTDILYHDWRRLWRAEEASDFDGNYLFELRYYMFQEFTSDAYPGLNTNPIMVDIMFQIVSINERKSSAVRIWRIRFYNGISILRNCNEIMIQ